MTPRRHKQQLCFIPTLLICCKKSSMKFIGTRPNCDVAMCSTPRPRCTVSFWYSFVLYYFQMQIFINIWQFLLLRNYSIIIYRMVWKKWLTKSWIISKYMNQNWVTRPLFSFWKHVTRWCWCLMFLALFRHQVRLKYTFVLHVRMHYYMNK